MSPSIAPCAVHYTVCCGGRGRHELRVDTGFTPQALVTRLELPVWIAGSYLVREFARHLNGLRVSRGEGQITPDGKSAWLLTVPPTQVGQALQLTHTVYAFDDSVRTAMACSDRIFFNPTSLCLRVQGQHAQPHRIALHGVPAGWDVATGLDRITAQASGSDPAQAWQTDSYALLADHPFEIAPFWRGTFDVRGVPHEFVVSGAWPDFDGERLLNDTRRICEAEMALWHPDGSAPPFSRYVFMLNAVENGYGGLEHINSTALIAQRDDLPTRLEAQVDGRAVREGYIKLLGLISHEYFHTWSVKRLKPFDLHPIDDQRENFTRLLWFFEGLTSYYDDLLLLRAGLISPEQHLALLSTTLQSVWNGPGRRVQSVEQASHDAWIRYYRPDENTPNSTVSYYAKGALVGWALDALLRSNASTLDDLMRWLWQRGGQNALTAPDDLQGGLSRPIALADILEGLHRLTGQDLSARVMPWLEGTDELPLAELLTPLGLTVPPAPGASVWDSLAEHTPDTLGSAWPKMLSPAALGLRLRVDAGRLRVTAVINGSTAHTAEVSAHDEIIAVAGWRVRSAAEVGEVLARLWHHNPESCCCTEWTLCRDQRLRSVTVDLRQGEALPQAVTIHLAPGGAYPLEQ